MNKFRYQNKNFKKNLADARHYKRNAKKVPQTQKDIFLVKLGLGSWSARIALVFVIGLMFYAAYIPNFLYFKHITVSGLKINERDLVYSEINKYFKTKSIWPKANYLFFSTNDLKSYLSKGNLNILSVESVDKKFPDSLNINIKARYAKYYSADQLNSYQISEDGIVLFVAPKEFEQPRNLLKINFFQTAGWVVGQKVILGDMAELMSATLKELPENTGLQIKTFEINQNEQLDLSVLMENDFIIKLDVKTNLADSQKNLKALFNQIPKNSNLAYIDLRLPERAYICYKNTPCALNDMPNVAGISTTSPTNHALKIKE